MRALRSFLLSLLALTTATFAQGIYPGDAVRVNDETVSYQRFQGFYVEYRNSKGVAVGARGDQLDLLTRLRREAMDLLVEQVLVGQAAEEVGIEPDLAAVDQQITNLRSIFDREEQFQMKLKEEGFTEESFGAHLARMMAAQSYLDAIRAEHTEVTDAELEQYYADNTHRLTLPEQVRVRHVLITWKPLGKPDDRAYIREQIEPILERARAGEDFAALAREYSDDYATKQVGGDTGFFRRGEMAPQFEAVAFELEPGEISGVVETAFGVHIIKLVERQDSELLPLDEIREQLREHVRNERAEAAVRNEIDRLKAAADIEVLVPLGPADDASE